jgi:F0F1-type ATP synthase assembly protein I
LLGFAAGVLNVMRSAGIVAGSRFDSGFGKDREG